MNDNNIRFEAEFYNSKTGLNDNFFYGKDIIDFVQYGTSNELNEDNLGYPILRLNEFDSNFIGIPSKYCNSITQDIFENLRLLKNDVLICRTNGNPKYVGKSAIVMKDTQFAYASYLFKIRPKKEKINSSTLTIFLNSKYGRQEIEKYSMVSNQANFSPAKFKEIKIPIFSNTFQLEIETFVKTSYQKLEDSKNLYKEAESLLLKELDLVDFTPKNENIAIKSFKDSFMQTGRLDSEYYQAKYDELIDHIKKANFDKLDNIVNIKKSIEPGSEAYQDSGIPFIRVSNVTKFGISDTDIYLSRNILKEEELQKLYPTKDTILLSKDGTVGIAYKIKNETEMITSGALLHLSIKKDDVLPEYLTLVLNSLIVQLQAQRDAGGSIIQHWKPSEIQEVLIPIIDISIQNQIEEKIKKSFELKEDSKQLLDLAKKAVEIAIEKDENEAVEFINEQI